MDPAAAPAPASPPAASRYRRNRAKAATEITLAVLVAICGTAWFGVLGYGRGWTPDLGVVVALTAWVISVIPTGALPGLGYMDRFDTAEYPSPAETG